MLKCKECGQRLERISNAHLLKCSKMTIQEYSIKHGIPLQKLVMDNLNYKINSLKEEKDQIIHTGSIEPEAISILTGTLLGGETRVKCTEDTLNISHGVQQLDYLLWKGLKLKQLGSKFYQYYKYDETANRYVAYNEVRVSLKPINDIVDVFYKKNFDKMEEYLDSLSLAVWYMDNGDYYPSCNICELRIQNFTSKEVDQLIGILNKKFNLFPVKRDFVGSFSLQFFLEEQKKLFEIISPYIISSMQYKLDIKSPKMTISKRVHFDSAHYLEDHPAKCYNLHGGRYFLDVFIEGYISKETGMIMDYTYLKRIVKKYIVDRFDHHFINAQEKTLNWRSTTELICIFIWFTLIEFLPNLKKIVLWETPDSSCEFIGPSYKEIKTKEKEGKVHDHLKFLNSFLNKPKQNRVIGKVEYFNDNFISGVCFDFTEI